MLPLLRLPQNKKVAAFPLSCSCISTSVNAGRVLSQQPCLSPSPWQLGQLPGSHSTEMCVFSCNRYVWNSLSLSFCLCVCLSGRETARERVNESHSGKHVWKTNCWYDCATPETCILTYSGPIVALQCMWYFILDTETVLRFLYYESKHASYSSKIYFIDLYYVYES